MKKKRRGESHLTIAERKKNGPRKEKTKGIGKRKARWESGTFARGEMQVGTAPTRGGTMAPLKKKTLRTIVEDHSKERRGKYPSETKQTEGGDDHRKRRKKSAWDVPGKTRYRNWDLKTAWGSNNQCPPGGSNSSVQKKRGKFLGQRETLSHAHKRVFRVNPHRNVS